MTRILIVEDDAKLIKLLSRDFKREGYDVIAAADGLDGYHKAKSEKPDLIILDVMMPKMNGYDVCRNLRDDGLDIPIIMLTAKGQETEKVVGLEIGADDYIAKPFGGMELRARVKALLRRHARQLKKIEAIEFDGIKINFRGMEASRNGKSLDLTAKEFQILELLIRYEGEVLTRQQFLDEIWESNELPSARTVDNQIVNLRQKLSQNEAGSKDYIQTLHGVGYKFVR